MFLLQKYKYISYKYNGIMVVLMLKLCIEIGHKYIYLYLFRAYLYMCNLCNTVIYILLLLGLCILIVQLP
jgi:hypothetical protein